MDAEFEELAFGIRIWRSLDIPNNGDSMTTMHNSTNSFGVLEIERVSHLAGDLQIDVVFLVLSKMKVTLARCQGFEVKFFKPYLEIFRWKSGREIDS